MWRARLLEIGSKLHNLHHTHTHRHRAFVVTAGVQRHKRPDRGQMCSDRYSAVKGQGSKVTHTVRVPRFSTRHRSTARSPRLTVTFRGVDWNTGTNWTSGWLSMTSSGTDHCAAVSTSRGWPPMLTNTNVAAHTYTYSVHRCAKNL